MNKEWWDEFWGDPMVSHLVRQNIPKVFIDAFTDEDVKDELRDVGKAATEFNKIVADYSKKKKE